MAKANVSAADAVKCLKKEYGITMTNQKRLALMSAKKVAEELSAMMNDKFAHYMDIESWLKSTNPSPVYFGEDAVCVDPKTGHADPCKIVGRDKNFGNEYIKILLLSDNEAKRGVYNAPPAFIKTKEEFTELKKTEEEPDEASGEGEKKDERS